MIRSDITSFMMLVNFISWIQEFGVLYVFWFLVFYGFHGFLWFLWHLVNTKRNVFDHKLKRDENSGRKKKDEYELAEE